MKTLVPFDINLAMKAWQKPDDNGISFELYTRDERKVIPSRERSYYWIYPFKAKIQGSLPLEQTPSNYWMENGRRFADGKPYNDDLQLFKITNND